MSHDLYQEITDKIIEQLEAGTAPWRKPWDGGPELTMPVNKVTGNRYQGVNITILWMTSNEKNYMLNQWASYNQWASKGENVAKGEKGTTIVYFDTMIKKQDDEEVKIPFIKASTVFNVAQLKGYTDDTPLVTFTDKFESIAKVDEFVRNTGAMVYPDGGNSAYYKPMDDTIHMPLQTAFKNTDTQSAVEGYYSTVLHELCHWTGHKSRLNRKMADRFGTGGYAMEELVAEMGAAYLCADLHISDGPKVDHAQYLGHWLGVMKEDKKAIFTASSASSKACDYLHKLQTVKQPEVLTI